jgi:hypothetical protein
VARVLQKIDAVDLSVRVVDTHLLASNDPNGLDIFYLLLVATVAGMVTVFQVRGHAPGLELPHHVSFVVGLALLASTVLTLVDGPLLHRPAALYPEEWGILAVHVLAVSSFSSLMAVLLGPWAIVPSWSFFVILGNASGGHHAAWRSQSSTADSHGREAAARQRVVTPNRSSGDKLCTRP